MIINIYIIKTNIKHKHKVLDNIKDDSKLNNSLKI